MNCRMCGHYLPDNVKYCPMCGMDQNAPKPVYVDKFVDSAEYWRGLKKREKFLFFIVFAIVGIVIAVLVVNICFPYLF